MGQVNRRYFPFLLFLLFPVLPSRPYRRMWHSRHISLVSAFGSSAHGMMLVGMSMRFSLVSVIVGMSRDAVLSAFWR